MACERDQEPAVQAELKLMTVNGQEIELNNFVQDFVGRAVIGKVGPLRGVADAQTLTLSISKREA